jgi:hypothetical protein
MLGVLAIAAGGDIGRAAAVALTGLPDAEARLHLRADGIRPRVRAGGTPARRRPANAAEHFRDEARYGSTTAPRAGTLPRPMTLAIRGKCPISAPMHLISATDDPGRDLLTVQGLTRTAVANRALAWGACARQKGDHACEVHRARISVHAGLSRPVPWSSRVEVVADIAPQVPHRLGQQILGPLTFGFPAGTATSVYTTQPPAGASRTRAAPRRPAESRERHSTRSWSGAELTSYS